MVETRSRQVIVLRHAKTEQQASSDRARELTSRGRQDARAAGRWLRSSELVPDLVFTSPAARARATADLVCAELGSSVEVRVVDHLYGADVTDAIEVLQTADAQAAVVLVVGHNPTMEELVQELQREPADEWGAHLPTAGLAVLGFSGSWADLAPGSANLQESHVPRG